jgi:hypothetical protein
MHDYHREGATQQSLFPVKQPMKSRIPLSALCLFVWMRIRTMMLAVTMLAVILATASHWIASGCPIGFACGACQTSLGGRMIIASSDHLLTHISLFSDTKSAVLDVEGARIVVRESEVSVDGTTPCLIPAGCKKIEFKAAGGVLRILADGETIREIHR